MPTTALMQLVSDDDKDELVELLIAHVFGVSLVRSTRPADRLLAGLKPIDFVQCMKKLDEDVPGDMRHVVSRLSTSILVKYFEFLRVDITSMSRSELIEELLLQIDRAPLL